MGGQLVTTTFDDDGPAAYKTGGERRMRVAKKTEERGDRHLFAHLHHKTRQPIHNHLDILTEPNISL